MNRLILSILALVLTYNLSAQSYDLVILNGKVMDGSGNPWYYQDLGIVDGKIVKLGLLQPSDGKEVIDVRGKIVSPGFIDIHSHADGNQGDVSGIRKDHPMMKAAHNLVMQGITTVVVNHDGRSPESIADQIAQLERQGHGPNVAVLVGHNSIRYRALGEDFKRLATPEEIKNMQSQIIEGMKAGAFGMSAGLEYVPGRWSNTEEVISLVSTVKPWGGVYIVHERASGSDPMWFLPSRDMQKTTMLENIEEVIAVAEATGVTSSATHVKVKGADYWGVSTAIVNLIQTARNRGVDIWADQYPYNTTGTDGNTELIPGWAIERDRWRSSLTGSADDNSGPETTFKDALTEVLENDEQRAKLFQDVKRELERRGGPENIIVFDYPDESFIGKSILALSQELDISLVEVAVKLQREGYPDRPGGARLRGFSLSEMDIEILAQAPWLITTTDAGISPPENPPVHARYYGTYPRKIAHYAKKRGVISVEHAIRSSTSLPAQFMGFKDRGMIKEGYAADIVIFDLEEIEDKATFVNPHQYPAGIEQVLIGGEFMVKDGELTKNLPGRVIKNTESFRYLGGL
ncbi:MAG: amidohydrolase family protein [Cyclobacteriaceae bacterium]